jgi:hypothetical protein
VPAAHGRLGFCGAQRGAGWPTAVGRTGCAGAVGRGAAGRRHSGFPQDDLRSTSCAQPGIGTGLTLLGLLSCTPAAAALPGALGAGDPAEAVPRVGRAAPLPQPRCQPAWIRIRHQNGDRTYRGWYRSGFGACPRRLGGASPRCCAAAAEPPAGVGPAVGALRRRRVRVAAAVHRRLGERTRGGGGLSRGPPRGRRSRARRRAPRRRGRRRAAPAAPSPPPAARGAAPAPAAAAAGARAERGLGGLPAEFPARWPGNPGRRARRRTRDSERARPRRTAVDGQLNLLPQLGNLRARCGGRRRARARVRAAHARAAAHWQAAQPCSTRHGAHRLASLPHGRTARSASSGRAAWHRPGRAGLVVVLPPGIDSSQARSWPAAGPGRVGTETGPGFRASWTCAGRFGSFFPIW